MPQRKMTTTEILVKNLTKTISDIKRGKNHSFEELELTKRRFESLHKTNQLLHEDLIVQYVSAISLHKPSMISALK